MKPADKIKELINKSDVATSPDADQRILADALKHLDKLKRNKLAPNQPNIGRIIMKSRISILAAAAVIVIAVLVGINQFGGSVTSVAWADVAEKVEKIHTYVFRVRQTETSGPKKGFEFVTEKEGITYNSLEYGNKTEFYSNGELTTKSYQLRKENEFVGICPPAKMYDRRPLSEADIREMDQMSPREIVKRFMSAEYSSLGLESIDGIKVEGIEVSDPKVLKENPPPIESFTAQLWVDVETELPVWLELEFVPVGSTVWTKMVIDRYQWNVEFYASDFEPNIPADYKPELHRSTAVKPKAEQLPLEHQTVHVDIPDINGLNLLGIQDEKPITTVALVGMKQIWKAQDAIMSTWPEYSDTWEQLHEELVAKLEINNLSGEQLVRTAVALREKFWQAGGCLSETSYPYGYAARILLEIAHEEDIENMTATDELVETIQSVEVAWVYRADSEEQIKNIQHRDLLIELRSVQFEQIKRELERGRVPLWKDFVRVDDLALLLGISKNYESALEAAEWLIIEAEHGGWTAYMQPLKSMQQHFAEGEKYFFNTQRATQCEFPEEFRHSRRLPSFKGPKNRGATPLHLLDSNPVWTGD